LKTKNALNQEYPERREQVFWVFRGLPEKRKEQSEHQKTKDPPFGNQTHLGTPLRRSFRPPLFSFPRRNQVRHFHSRSVTPAAMLGDNEGRIRRVPTNRAKPSLAEARIIEWASVEPKMMRVPTFAFLALASAFGQQFEVLNSNLPGLVARDSQGNWIIADGFNPNLAKLRVRKFSLDLTQTLFDRQIGGSGSDQPMRLRLDEFGNIYVLGFTTSKDFPTTPGVVWPRYDVDTSYFFVKLNSQGTSNELTSRGFRLKPGYSFFHSESVPM